MGDLDFNMIEKQTKIIEENENSPSTIKSTLMGILRFVTTIICAGAIFYLFILISSYLFPTLIPKNASVFSNFSQPQYVRDIVAAIIFGIISIIYCVVLLKIQKNYFKEYPSVKVALIFLLVAIVSCVFLIFSLAGSCMFPLLTGPLN
jgi:H+/Cl- antiporter ClcA